MLKWVKIHWYRSFGGVAAATPPNEPHQCILTHFNNCNFSKAQMVCSRMNVFYTEIYRSFTMSILIKFKIIFKIIQLCISWWRDFDNNIYFKLNYFQDKPWTARRILWLRYLLAFVQQILSRYMWIQVTCSMIHFTMYIIPHIYFSFILSNL